MREENWLNDYVFTIDNFFSREECQQYIELSEDYGFEEATVTSATGSVRISKLRNNDRVMFKNKEVAEWLFDRLIDFVPSEFDGRAAKAVNELFRFYRYEPGQQFDWHQDFPYERDNGEKSYLTLLVYLNDDFEGGETSFDDSYSDEPFDEFSVQPTAGMALLFLHETHHKGEKVLNGCKYVLRSDVMYAAEQEAIEPDYEADSNLDW